MENDKPKKPIAKISEEKNANIFRLITICKIALIDEGMYREAEQMANRIYETNSFEEDALKIMAEYCELI
jgi:hypothetical protein